MSEVPVFAKRVEKFLDDKKEFGVSLESINRETWIAVIKHKKWGHITVDCNTGEIDTQISHDEAIIKVLKQYLSGEIEAKEAAEAEESRVEEEDAQLPRSVQPDAIKPPSPMKGFRPAKRSKAKLRLALTGPAGSGKTASALLIARGLTDSWEKIGMVDTEAGSGELYVGSMMGDTKIGSYNVLPLEAPYTPSRYIEAIKLAEEAGLDVLIIDSLSHAWEGEGGVLEMHDLATMASKSQNSYFAWRDVTPQHKALIDKILHSKIHVIATMRTKTEYVLGEKNTPHKVGLAPIQRAGTDYEFGVVFELSQQHVAIATKDRTNLFDGLKFKPTIETGEMLLKWLEEES